jgi:aspartyl-tRNA synthetase
VFTDEEIELGDLPKTEEKKEEKKDTREAKKAERLAARQNKVAAQVDENKKDLNDPSASLFGERELNRSQGDPELRFTKKILDIKDIDAKLDGQVVICRGRLHNSRAKGKLCFVVVRQQFSTIQAMLAMDDKISKGMVNYASKVPRESIIEIKAKVTVPENPVETCSQKVELQVQEFWVINKSAPILPFQIEDASRLVTNQAAEDGGAGGDEETKEGEKKGAVVKQDIRLNNRIIDLRVPANQAIFKIQSGVCRLYREFMIEKDFIEIHSPKMIGGASEGGANVFTFKYFGQDACMAQSPQLYKQMALCGDFDRVFEIGPVFRAEDSNTNRHLCEFTGLDMEMTIKEHYFEVLDMLGDLLIHIFNGLETRYKAELDVIKQQYPFEDFKCKSPVVKINFKDGVKMLHEAGVEQGPLDDLSTETEKALGKIIKEKYDTDFYMLYGYPAAARPFYTMLDPHDQDYTNSYDFFMRGEEITSGAQRIHDPDMLTERAKHFDIPVNTIQDYIDSFKYGAPAHGGAGFGLERIVKFYCNLHNIRKSSLFPRDPKRIKP